MIAMNTLANSDDSFIKKGLIEIFGNDFYSENREANSLISIKEHSSRQLGSAEMDGLILRAGRAGFFYWMRKNSEELGWKEVEYRLLPPSTRISRSITDLINWMKREGFFLGELSETPEVWRISISGLTGTNARLECSFFTGMLQELSCWAGGGKFYPTRESECQAAGAAQCVFLVDKKPAD